MLIEISKWMSHVQQNLMYTTCLPHCFNVLHGCTMELNIHTNAAWNRIALMNHDDSMPHWKYMLHNRTMILGQHTQTHKSWYFVAKWNKIYDHTMQPNHWKSAALLHQHSKHALQHAAYRTMILQMDSWIILTKPITFLF